MARLRGKVNDPPITAAQVAEFLIYDKDTGLFTWKKGVRGSSGTGNIAGTTAGPYCSIGVLGHRVYAQRLAWLLSYGEWPNKFVDHINGDKQDNRLANLREADHCENQWNTTYTSIGIPKGISYSKKDRRWVVQIQCRSKKLYQGFKTLAEATEFATLVYAELHGEFSSL